MIKLHFKIFLKNNWKEMYLNSLNYERILFSHFFLQWTQIIYFIIEIVEKANRIFKGLFMANNQEE